MDSDASKVKRLKETVRRLRERLAHKDAIIESLREDNKALRHLVKSFTVLDDSDSGRDRDTDMDDGEQGEETPDAILDSASPGADATAELPEPFYDNGDCVFRCVKCSFEVCDGICQNAECAQKHAYDAFDKSDETHGAAEYFKPVSTEDSFFNSDRSLATRGTTPLLHDAAAAILGAPLGYDSEEYSALISRGATYSMIEAFQLHFSDAEGIVATADDQLFREYSSDHMCEGDGWRIHLGRRLYLHHNDLDGSLFLEELLEEIMHTPRPDRWETVKEDDTWITRPVSGAITLDANGDDNDIEFDSDGYQVYSGYSSSDLEDGEFEEDAKYEKAVAADQNPLLVEDDYETDETEEEEAEEAAEEAGDDDDGKQEDVDAEEEHDTDASSSTDWSAFDLTEQEKKRRAPDQATSVAGDKEGGEVAGGGDGEGETDADESDDSDEPGSDWDSNDGIP